MKRLSFILILLVLVQVAWAQQDQQHLERLDSIITSLSSGRPTKYVYHYDADRRLAETIEYTRRKEEWANPLMSIYTYDENGRVTVKERHISLS